MVQGYLLAALATVAPFVVAQSTCTTTSAISSPTPPASDPFWQPPSDLSTRAPGSVFNCRQVSWMNVNGARAYYQYAYKTVRKDGVSAVGVATLLLPNNTATKFSKLLSYQIPYDSPTSFCGPSYVFQNGVPGNTANTYGVSSNSGDQSPTQALAAGIPVVIADYETNYASFTVGITSGFATINGIRAVIQASGFFNPNPSVALWGYSGGALATDFALELAGTQATDLTIIGAALGGLTPITRNTAIMVNGPHNFGPQDFFNALIPYGLLGISNENSTVSNWVQTNLKNTIEPGAPDSRTYKIRFNSAASDACNLLTGGDYTNSDFNNWFNLGASPTLFDVPTVRDALNVYGIMGQTGSAGRTTPKPPLYFYKGTADEVSAVGDTTDLFNKYCAAGARITYVEYVGQTHVGAGTQGLGPAWDYLKARFDGTPVAAGCSTTSVAASSSASATS